MSWFSSRSIITDPIRIAMPKPIQPNADRKSPRRLAMSSCPPGDDAGAVRSGEDIGVTYWRFGRTGFRTARAPRLGNPHRIGRTLGLAAVQQQPGIGLPRGEYR